MNANHHVLFIPCKPFAQAKSRLGGVLNARQREKLARALYVHTLATVAACRTEFEAIVISSDEEALECARAAGLGHVSESASHGLNEALHAALMRYPRRQGVRFAYLPIDLPLLCPGDLDQVAQGDPEEFVIAPDRQGRGTNFLSWPAEIELCLSFGPSSFSAHCREAARLDLAVRVVTDAHFEQDLDVPADLPDDGPFARIEP